MASLVRILLVGIILLQVEASVYSVAQRVQRDLTVAQTLDQLVFSGVNLNKAVWDTEGYKTSTLTYIQEFLQNGANVLELNLYWNEASEDWQLCPEALLPNVTGWEEVQSLGDYECELGLNLSSVLTEVNTYITSTHTKLNADVMELYLNVQSLESGYTYESNTSENTLSSILQDTVGDFIYTPSDLSADKDAGNFDTDFPTADYFLFTKTRRMLAIIMTDNIYSNSSYGSITDTDADVVFINNDNIEITSFSNYDTDIIEQNENITTQIAELAEQPFRVKIDNSTINTTSVTAFQDSLREGFSTIVNTAWDSVDDLMTTVDDIHWSWIAGQPNSSRTVTEAYSSVTSSNEKQVANRCAVFYDGGWIVDNCYNSRRVACRSETNVYLWTLTDSKHAYLYASGCPTGYEFAAPASTMENLALAEYLSTENISEPVWIDLNCVSVQNCWVTGGPHQSCPYDTNVTRKLFNSMITPASVVLAILAGAMIALRFHRTPVQKNRRYWKRLINEFNEKDYEGVPS